MRGGRTTARPRGCLMFWIPIGIRFEPLSTERLVCFLDAAGRYRAWRGCGEKEAGSRIAARRRMSANGVADH